MTAAARMMMMLRLLLTEVGLLDEDEPLGALVLVPAGLVQGGGDDVGAGARLGDLRRNTM